MLQKTYLHLAGGEYAWPGLPKTRMAVVIVSVGLLGPRTRMLEVEAIAHFRINVTWWSLDVRRMSVFCRVHWDCWRLGAASTSCGMQLARGVLKARKPPSDAWSAMGLKSSQPRWCFSNGSAPPPIIIGCTRS